MKTWLSSWMVSLSMVFSRWLVSIAIDNSWKNVAKRREQGKLSIEILVVIDQSMQCLGLKESLKDVDAKAEMTRVVDRKLNLNLIISKIQEKSYKKSYTIGKKS